MLKQYLINIVGLLVMAYLGRFLLGFERTVLLFLVVIGAQLDVIFRNNIK